MFSCEYCNKEFRSRSGHRYHIRNNVCRQVPSESRQSLTPSSPPPSPPTFEELNHLNDDHNFNFQKSIKVQSLAMGVLYDKYKHLEHSNKAIFPQYVFNDLMRECTLSRMSDEEMYPIIFQLEPTSGISFIVHVHEFVEGLDVVYLPHRIMSMHALDQNALVKITKVPKKDMAKGEKMVLRAHKTAFASIKNIKSYLEKALMHNYVSVSEGDTLSIWHDETHREYLIDVMKTEPKEHIMINNTDLTVDFEEPLDYKKIMEEKRKEKEEDEFREHQKRQAKKYAEFKRMNGYIPFGGKGRRLGRGT